MNRKIMSLLLAVAAIVAVAAFASLVGTAKAQIAVSMELKDSHGNSIVNSTVPINTTAHIYCTYEDPSGSVSATGVMKVYYNNVYKETLYSGIVADGETITEEYQMKELGTYEFRWDCTKITAAGYSVQCVLERALVKGVTLVVPEAGTIAGLVMALSAFGLVAIRRIKQ